MSSYSYSHSKVHKSRALARVSRVSRVSTRSTHATRAQQYPKERGDNVTQKEEVVIFWDVDNVFPRTRDVAAVVDRLAHAVGERCGEHVRRKITVRCFGNDVTFTKRTPGLSYGETEEHTDDDDGGGSAVKPPQPRCPLCNRVFPSSEVGERKLRKHFDEVHARDHIKRERRAAENKGKGSNKRRGLSDKDRKLSARFREAEWQLRTEAKTRRRAAADDTGIANLEQRLVSASVNVLCTRLAKTAPGQDQVADKALAKSAKNLWRRCVSREEGVFVALVTHDRGLAAPLLAYFAERGVRTLLVADASSAAFDELAALSSEPPLDWATIDDPAA